MLRITTDEDPRVITFRLEGRLEGPWVELLAKCWRGTRAVSNGKRLRVDLDGVTFVDAAGRAGLERMHEQGAEFVAHDLMTKAIVEEIVGH